MLPCVELVSVAGGRSPRLASSFGLARLIDVRLLVLSFVSVVVGCAPSERPPTPGWAPVAGMSGVVIEGERMSYAQLLGLEREAIESVSSPTGSDRDGQWIHYGPDLRIAFEDGIAVRLRARTPQQFGCTEAARWMGFPLPRQPIVRSPRCQWPGHLIRHQLEKGYGGEYRFDTHWFLIWMRPEADPDILREPSPGRAAS
jgi:hypothetical protein